MVGVEGGASEGGERAVGTTACVCRLNQENERRGRTYGERSGLVRVREAFGAPVDAVGLCDFVEVEIDVRFGRLGNGEPGHDLSGGVSKRTLTLEARTEDAREWRRSRPCCPCKRGRNHVRTWT